MQMASIYSGHRLTLLEHLSIHARSLRVLAGKRPILSGMGSKQKAWRLRRITISGSTFYYTAKWRYPDGHRTVILTVWGDDKSHRPLRANIRAWAITPKGVRAIIEYALTRGWNPATRGAPFDLSANELASLEEDIKAALQASLPHPVIHD